MPPLSVLPGDHPFPTTQWSVVALVKDGEMETTGQERHRALDQLCQVYWKPLFVFARRTGLSPHDAEDAVQQFLASLLAKNFFAGADGTKGRMRGFLCVAFKNFLSNQHRASGAKKRGGDCVHFSIHAEDGETSGAWQISALATADDAYTHRWACALLEHSMARLQKEYADRGQDRVFEALNPLMSGDGAAAEAAVELGMKEGTVRVALSRMRRRFGVILRENVQATLLPGEDVEDELGQLMAALAQG